MKQTKPLKPILRVAMLLLLCALPLTASAYDFMVDGIAYNRNSDGNSISVTYTVYSTNNYSGLTTANIPSSVTYNGITYSVTSIGYNAFSHCSGLTSVTIPKSITSIGNNAFSGCSGLTNVTIPDSVTSIGNSAFFYCRGLTSVTIPNSVTYIGDEAFYGCRSLTSVTIPNSVTSIGGGAFSGCSGLTSVTIPNSVTSIGSSTFSGCSGLTSVTIPNSVTSIGSSAFSGCSGLTSVTIGNSVTYIGDEAFYGSGLTSVTFGNSVTYIGDGAFAYCTSLTSINIPSSVTHISMCLFWGDGVASSFMGCSNLETIIVDSGNTKYDSRDNCNAIIETATNTLIIGCKNTTIPNSVKYIGDGSFYGSGLTSITIPHSVTEIGDAAFSNCSELTSMTISNSVTYIGFGAFGECSSLTCLTLIGQGAFTDTYSTEHGIDFPNDQIKTLNIGSGITALGVYGFTPEVVNCYAVTPPACSAYTFRNYDGALHVPTASLIDYMTANYWQNFMNVNPDINEKIALDQTNATIALNETLQLEATTLPNESGVTWSTTNPGVTTVDENGLVTATGLGECYIYATLASNEAVYACCHITVIYPEIVSVTLSEHELQLNLGDSTTLTATTNPANTGPAPTWTTTDVTVATVDANGLIKAVDVGECDIIVTVLGKSDTCHVLVTGNVIITLDQHELTIDINHVGTIVPTCTPVATDLVVTSSDPSVVFARIMTQNGTPKVQIAGMKQGTATVTVSSVDGNAIPDSCVVNVIRRVGDLNADGYINVTDITVLIDIIMGNVDEPDDTEMPYCDLNADGVINVIDITALIDIIMNS